ncbi:carbon-nitrogen hydrolase [Luminiphilus syltensis NOR5-1B]|uniref:Carbon-nitrogen hydrolase n=1 Tax=Luminiphilus syltensis NOR5-1B TaxID=565045 RepID=B8KTF6_9GAMM|nr:carbon-nitrogen hydrolase family protein [Luminiphilus syltensis]EED36284.1 carbon-nitrogen hydrolase [Luminiphilus syltensis NOR5-1B]
MSKIGIAGLQLEAINGDNTDSIEAEIDAVARRYQWVDMVVLGELNALGSNLKFAQPMPGGEFEARFSEIAKRHGIWLIPGSIMEKSGGQYFNTAPVINPDGEVIARYRKQFPWLPYENGVTPGTEAVVFDVPGVGRFGVSICYDMWFPETLRALSCMGAEVIIHPTLTSTIDREVEQCMVRAHAASHQCYFFDVNVAGPLGVGQSIVAGPGGEVIHCAGRDREIIPLRLDLSYVRDVRANGWHGLGQPLKSFRDSTVPFPCYEKSYSSPALDALGPIKVAEAETGRKTRE